MKKYVFLFIATSLIAASCGQIRELKTLSKCEFQLDGIDILAIDDSDVSNIKFFKDIDLVTASKLVVSLLDKEAIMKYAINVNVRNPNKQTAGLNKMEMLIFFNEVEIAKGYVNEPVIIEGNGQKKIPFTMTSEISKVITNIDSKTILSLFFPGKGKVSSLFTIKVKPSIKVGKREIMYPNYLTLSQEYKEN